MNRDDIKPGMVLAAGYTFPVRVVAVHKMVAIRLLDANGEDMPKCPPRGVSHYSVRLLNAVELEQYPWARNRQ